MEILAKPYKTSEPFVCSVVTQSQDNKTAFYLPWKSDFQAGRLDV